MQHFPYLQPHPGSPQPIGGSLLDVLRNNNDKRQDVVDDQAMMGSEEEEKNVDLRSNRKRNYACLSPSHNSHSKALLLHNNNDAAVGSNSNNKSDDPHCSSTFKTRNRILLCGPAKSGKSSLAMNLAYAKASSVAPCLCLDPNLCNCIAVTMYMPSSMVMASATSVASSGANRNIAIEEEDDFPLLCRRLYENGEERSNPQDNDDAPLIESATADFLSWDPYILKRIRIHRVESVRELLHDLLGMLGKPIQEHPRSGGAIVIDNIDTFVARDPVIANKGNAYRNATTAAILQAIAVASDTAMALETAHESSCHKICEPLSLLVTAQDVHTVLSPCIDTIVTLRHLSNNDNSDTSPWKLKRNHGDDTSDDAADDDDDDHSITVTSVWSAHICSSPYTSPETIEDQHTIIKYAVVETSAGADGAGGDRELRWKPDGGGTMEDVEF